MGMTVGQLLTELEKPENAHDIKHLVHLKHLHNLDALKEKPGGLLTRIVLAFIRKHMDAFIALSECANVEDIAAFKQTKHYDKIKNATVGENLNLSDLRQLEELQNITI